MVNEISITADNNHIKHKVRFEKINMVELMGIILEMDILRLKLLGELEKMKKKQKEQRDL